ncbi:hypothetical protein [Candidatus Nitrosotalea okcheonensis]|uniref:Uncharacterized protein n=1 Tax=Candidatus Nitrosotalea okcheonensis TaxID=1903276 RepID=A0A2H1FFS3_9ARCH|nr:hypothetical protein [Candidatus Nitrosotalea okcheonensis]MDE1728210.1 hypothetical protein [Nitrososphaerota archaeon]MDE1831300.1 hypothetical protein [Nitrososphaerota archaeon]MDE1840782.1 hypothetical protein [Nitrososphaerota archaeon]MDE1878137.1 hypothetical protein [Nitrososphaerota archaeon]SMH71621.1 conserved protein of unknown function [Candidatus Nitrosotalea okcheonensis]
MDIQVHINNVRGSQIAAKITGTFNIDGHQFKFNAIAFGRIGGHNIGAKISKMVEKSLVNLGYDVDEVINELQQKLVRGDITLPEGLTKESFADG